MNYKEIFPKRLKEVRIAKGKNQNEMAIALDIARPSYANFERGKTYPKFENLIKIAEELEISIDYLVGIRDDKNIIKKTENYINQTFNIENKGNIKIKGR